MDLSPLRRLSGRVSPLALAALVLAVLLGTTGGAVAGAMITGKQIKNGTVTSVDIKNGSLKGVDIKNGSLTGADIADEARSWSAMNNAETEDFTSAEYTPVVSRTLTSPKGFLTITGTLYAEDDFTLGGLGYLLYTLRIDGKPIDTYKALDYHDAGRGQNGAITVSVPVAAGGHTVQLVVQEYGDGSYLYGGELSVIYTASGSSSGVEFARPTHGRTTNR